jgi:hypothetical protein
MTFTKSVFFAILTSCSLLYCLYDGIYYFSLLLYKYSEYGGYSYEGNFYVFGANYPKHYLIFELLICLFCFVQMIQILTNSYFKKNVFILGVLILIMGVPFFCSFYISKDTHDIHFTKTVLYILLSTLTLTIFKQKLLLKND